MKLVFPQKSDKLLKYYFQRSYVYHDIISTIEGDIALIFRVTIWGIFSCLCESKVDLSIYVPLVRVHWTLVDFLEKQRVISGLINYSLMQPCHLRVRMLNYIVNPKWLQMTIWVLDVFTLSLR